MTQFLAAATKGSRVKPALTTVIAVAVFALCLVVLLVYVQRYGENVPFLDEWVTSLSIAEHTRQGNLSLHELFRQHVAHRIVFTNAVTAINTVLFDWNIKLEMFLNVALACLSLALVCSLARWSLPLVLTATALMLSPKIDWTWAFNSQSHFALLFILLAVWSLRRGTLRGLLAAMIAGLCATYSFAYGVFVWPLGFGLLAQDRAPRRWLTGWSVFSALNIALFALAFSPASGSFVFDAQKFLVFMPVYLGAAWVGSVSAALVVGCIGIGLGVWVIAALWRQRRVPPLWTTLACFSLAVGSVIGVSRASLGYWSGLEGRYLIMSNLYWIGLLALAIEVLKIRKRLSVKYAVVAVGGALFCLFIWTSFDNWRRPPSERIVCMLASANAPQPCVEPFLFPKPDAIPDRIQRMQQLRLGVFSEPCGNQKDDGEDAFHGSHQSARRMRLS
jgi:hypothetical protein